MEQDTSSMRIKSYFAGSVEQAIQEARQELGQEAMLITSRRAAPEARHLGAYEVVFGVHGSAVPASQQAPSRSKHRAPVRPATPPSAELSTELQNLRAQLEDIKRTLQLGTAQQPLAISESDELSNELVALDLALPVARSIVSEAQATRERTVTHGKPLRELVTEIIANKILCSVNIAGSALQPGSILAFAGPAGAGKTATLVKVAVREVLGRRLPLRIVSVDPNRVAAQEKLRTLAGILGAGFVAATTTEEFEEAVQEAQRKSVVLIDTPAFPDSEPESAAEIAECLAKFSSKALHLVLPASMKRTDLATAVRRYAPFQADFLLFTKLDETGSLGAVLSTTLETGKPLSYFTTGQGIPEDIEPAGVQKLLTGFLARPAAEAVSAA